MVTSNLNNKVTFGVYSLVFSINRMYTRSLLSTVTYATNWNRFRMSLVLVYVVKKFMNFVESSYKTTPDRVLIRSYKYELLSIKEHRFNVIE
jgi:uncharacterized membrane-anchored protein YitT (DUF2179 family)